MWLTLPSSCFAVALIFFNLAALLASEDDEDGGLGHGLGENIVWRRLDDGLLESKHSHKPLMLIIHKSWCGACKAFKPKFAESKEIEAMSRQFVMVNTQDDEEPTDPKYTPDGGYIPRVLFLDPRGEVMLEVYNESGNQNYRYYYYDSESVIGSMRRALEVMKGGRVLSDEL